MINNKYRNAAILVLTVAAYPLNSYANTDVNLRLEQAEKEIKQLKTKLNGTRAAIKENRTRITESSDRLKINGFISAGVAVNDGDDIEEPYVQVGSDYSTSSISKLGLQTSFKINDRWNAIAQLVSRGTQDYNISAEWAYLSYAPTDRIQLKFGRQRAPFYLLSEYLDVGYALPWTIAPVEMYSLTTSTVDGASLSYDMRLGSSKWTWQMYGGASQGRSEDAKADYKSNDAWGSNLVVEVADWTFRVGYSAGHLEPDADQGGPADQFNEAVESAFNTVAPMYGVESRLNYDGDNLNWDAQYANAGFSYDNGSLLVIGEISNLRVVDSYQPAGDAGYLTIGYRFGRWMPHITYAKFQTDSNSDKEVRALQTFLAETANAAYGSLPPGTPGLVATNTGVNAQLVAQNGLPSGAIPANYVLPTSACATLTCNGSLLAAMGIRDNLLTASSLYGETIYNVLEQRIQQQQSFTLGLVFDVTPGIRAKLQATQYDSFGSSNYQYLTTDSATFSGSQVSVLNGFETVRKDGNGRFVGSPGTAGKSTAIYSFSIDAVF